MMNIALPFRCGICSLVHVLVNVIATFELAISNLHLMRVCVQGWRLRIWHIREIRESLSFYWNIHGSCKKHQLLRCISFVCYLRSNIVNLKFGFYSYSAIHCLNKIGFHAAGPLGASSVIIKDVFNI